MTGIKAPRPARLRQALVIATSVVLGGTVASSGMAQTTAEVSTVAAAFADLTPPAHPVTAQPHAVDVTEVMPAFVLAPEAATEASTDLGTGVASFYADRFHGQRTASGERFDNQAYTAAHRTLPFGTRVRVTNPATGASVVVRINDRGPFTRGRTIDVSRVAAEELGLVRTGHGTVELELLQG